jgi:hypothetical protein
MSSPSKTVKKFNINDIKEKNGADRQIRTADLTLTKGALYQLSHISTDLERAVGIEPTSSAWKAEVIAIIRCSHALFSGPLLKSGGGSWIRTSEGRTVRFTV